MSNTPATEQHSDAIDAALSLKMVSIRLPIQLIEDFKTVASITNSPYQAVMRQCLADYACDKLIEAGREYLTRSKPKKAAQGGGK